MLRIVDTPLLWATFFLRCVPSVYRYGKEASLLMQPGLQPECGFSSSSFNPFIFYQRVVLAENSPRGMPMFNKVFPYIAAMRANN
jgi:hypothetical protein